MRKVVVKQTAGNEVPAEVLAESIVAISNGMKAIRSGRLNDRALVVLLKDTTGVAGRTIQVILDGLQSLESAYIRKPAVK